eukprot:GEMP01058505.1.p1 GENE.GEMP01058505.1~~GEMP01058505.1.p1  ORF type:complete len:348 (+),score=102.04 GEMP01058505.1:219-1262(+)
MLTATNAIRSKTMIKCAVPGLATTLLNDPAFQQTLLSVSSLGIERDHEERREQEVPCKGAPLHGDGHSEDDDNESDVATTQEPDTDARTSNARSNASSMPAIREHTPTAKTGQNSQHTPTAKTGQNSQHTPSSAAQSATFSAANPFDQYSFDSPQKDDGASRMETLLSIANRFSERDAERLAKQQAAKMKKKSAAQGALQEIAERFAAKEDAKAATREATKQEAAAAKRAAKVKASGDADVTAAPTPVALRAPVEEPSSSEAVSSAVPAAASKVKSEKKPVLPGAHLNPDCPDSQKIRCIPNPKQPGSKAHARYEQYQTATTKREYFTLGGKGDWRFDLAKGYIELL